MPTSTPRRRARLGLGRHLPRAQPYLISYPPGLRRRGPAPHPPDFVLFVVHPARSGLPLSRCCPTSMSRPTSPRLPPSPRVLDRDGQWIKSALTGFNGRSDIMARLPASLQPSKRPQSARLMHEARPSLAGVGSLPSSRAQAIALRDTLEQALARPSVGPHERVQAWDSLRHPCIHPCIHPPHLCIHPRLQSCLHLYIHLCIRLSPGMGRHDAPAGDAGTQPLGGAR